MSEANVTPMLGSNEPRFPKVIVHQGRPRFVIEKHAAWRDEWTVVEFAVDLKTATRRMDTLTRTIDAEMRIIDRGPSDE